VSASIGPLFASVAAPRASNAQLEFAVLGSSSSGNASVLRVSADGAERQILIDAGLSPRMTKGRMAALGFDLAQTNEILFTHFDHDHAREGWARFAQQSGITMRCARRHVRHAIARGYPESNLASFESDGGTIDLGPLRATVCENPHDDGATAAFRFESAAGTLGFATDVGRVSRGLIDLLRGVDLLAIESNYDPEMQRDSARPAILKSRITGGRGHLSNGECLDAVRDIAFPNEPSHVVLLHLSRDCNCPDLVRDLWHREAPSLARKLVLAQPHDAIAPIRLGSEAT
jgi:phosphoribosyl 1,2-cyclic phosphodiesterase